MEVMHHTQVTNVMISISMLTYLYNIVLFFFFWGHTLVFGCCNYTFHMAFEPVPLSWEDSRRLCNMTGKDLVSIESNEEWRFLNKTIQTMQTSEYFIGLKKQSGQWRWVSNDKNKSSSGRYLCWHHINPVVMETVLKCSWTIIFWDMMI